MTSGENTQAATRRLFRITRRLELRFWPTRKRSQPSQGDFFARIALQREPWDCFFVFFLLAIVMSVLRFMDSDYPFGIFKPFLCQLNILNLSVISWWKKVAFLLTMAHFDLVAFDLDLQYQDIFFHLDSLIHQNKYSSPPLIKPLQPNANPSFAGQISIALRW